MARRASNERSACRFWPPTCIGSDYSIATGCTNAKTGSGVPPEAPALPAKIPNPTGAETPAAVTLVRNSDYSMFLRKNRFRKLFLRQIREYATKLKKIVGVNQPAGKNRRFLYRYYLIGQTGCNSVPTTQTANGSKIGHGYKNRRTSFVKTEPRFSVTGASSQCCRR